MSAKAVGAGLENPMVIAGHFSVAIGPCEMVMLSDSTLSTVPCASWIAAIAAVGANANDAADAPLGGDDAGLAMLPRTERNRASESMRNCPLATTCSPSLSP